VTRVFILEDHPAVRQGFRMLLEPEGIEVCGEAETLAEARAALDPAAPDLVMVDLVLGLEDGTDLVRELAHGDPPLPVLVVSMHEGSHWVRRSLEAGARGYVTKRETVDCLILAIRALAAGRSYLSPRAAEALRSEGLPIR
jgi:DNA-binding NarL/FixJ family response regulator